MRKSQHRTTSEEPSESQREETKEKEPSIDQLSKTTSLKNLIHDLKANDIETVKKAASILQMLLYNNEEKCKELFGLEGHSQIVKVLQK